MVFSETGQLSDDADQQLVKKRRYFSLNARIYWMSRNAGSYALES